MLVARLVTDGERWSLSEARIQDAFVVWSVSVCFPHCCVFISLCSGRNFIVDVPMHVEENGSVHSRFPSLLFALVYNVGSSVHALGYAVVLRRSCVVVLISFFDCFPRSFGAFFSCAMKSLARSCFLFCVVPPVVFCAPILLRWAIPLDLRCSIPLDSRFLCCAFLRHKRYTETQ